jgi:hypothetical protein
MKKTEREIWINIKERERGGRETEKKTDRK